MPAAPDGRDTSACAVYEIHERDPVLVGKVLDESSLTPFAAVPLPAGSAADREILTPNRNQAAVD